MDDARRKALTDLLSEAHESFVLITCNAPDKEGNMDVDMCYGGDFALVSYLIKGAHQLVDQFEDADVETEAPLRLIK